MLITERAVATSTFQGWLGVGSGRDRHRLGLVVVAEVVEAGALGGLEHHAAPLRGRDLMDRLRTGTSSATGIDPETVTMWSPAVQVASE